jgi:integrase
MSTLTQRGKVWHARFRDAQGKRVSCSTKQTDIKKAREVLAKWEAAAKRELTATQVQRVMADIYREATGDTAQSFTAREYLHQWCENKAARGALRAADKYRQIVREFLEFLGRRADQPLRQLTEKDLSSFVLAAGKQVRARTANNKLTLLATALRDAWADNLLPDDICKRLKRIKLTEQEPMKRLPFTQDQVSAIIQAAEGEWKGIATLGAYTGQRLGDIVSWRWRNVGESVLAFTSRKTGRRMRVPLHPLADAWFTANRGQNSDDSPIFPISNAKLEKHRGNTSRLSDQFQGLLASLNYAEKRTHHTRGNGRNAKRAFSPLSFHSFRHFLTSQLHRAGVAPAIVKDIIGHESEAVHRIYTDIDDETKLLGIQKFVVPASPPPPPQRGVIEAFPDPAALKEVVNG